MNGLIQLTRRMRQVLYPVLILAGALPFTGCAVGPKYKTPAVPVPPAYKEMGNWKTAQPNDQNFGGTGGKSFRIRN